MKKLFIVVVNIPVALIQVDVGYHPRERWQRVSEIHALAAAAQPCIRTVAVPVVCLEP